MDDWKTTRSYSGLTEKDLVAFFRLCKHRGLRGWWHRKILKAHTSILWSHGNEVDRT